MRGQSDGRCTGHFIRNQSFVGYAYRCDRSPTCVTDHTDIWQLRLPEISQSGAKGLLPATSKRRQPRTANLRIRPLPLLSGLLLGMIAI